MIKFLFSVLMIISSFAIAQKNEDAIKYANIITENALKEKLSIIASADFEGRETGTIGQKKAAAYIEGQFKKFGLKPGNGNSYQQVWYACSDTLISTKLIVNGNTFNLDNNFGIKLNQTSNGKTPIKEVVFVGYGLPDDFEKVDVRNKIVLFLQGGPDSIRESTNEVKETTSYYAKVNNAINKGAAGAIDVSNDFPKERPTTKKGGLYFSKTDNFKFFRPLTISTKVASALLGQKRNLSFDKLEKVPKGLYAADVLLNVEIKTDTIEGSNVVGLLEGTDKKDEYVVLSAHYDHLGKQGKVIFYGADDDGSGTTGMLQMAEAFSKAKEEGNGPHRSIVFIAFSGEEKGLWGSDYYTKYPLFPLEKTSVDLNTDMVGRVGSEYKGDKNNYVYVIGEDKLSSDLMKISDSINTTAKLELDRHYNAPDDPEHFFYRSDHFNFASKGVPIIFYFDGVHKDYHKPTDTVDKINFALMEKRVRLIFNTAWAMANREDMLKRDHPLYTPSK